MHFHTHIVTSVFFLTTFHRIRPDIWHVCEMENDKVPYNRHALEDSHKRSDPFRATDQHRERPRHIHAAPEDLQSGTIVSHVRKHRVL